MQRIQLFLLIVFVTYCAADPGCPDPPKECLRCIDSCPKDKILATSPCGCCDNQCVPKQHHVCPDILIACKRCVDSCPDNETLVKSPCGCCYDKCVPRIKCPDPPIECLLCHWSCPDNQTLQLGPCGCCGNRCVPNVPDNSGCTPDICKRVKCALPTCTNGEILVQGQAICGCCPGCVKPKRGDKCYADFNTGQPTCGCGLRCCHGKCV